MTADGEDNGLMNAPDLPYRAPMPKQYSPSIGVIGAGGISASHLDAYRKAGWSVAALWNRTRARAEERAAEFCPDARVLEHWQSILDEPDIEVVDITLHPGHRKPIVEAALRAGKHVLSQKPFVTDLDEGERLVALARDKGVKLAVNQNGRWAPHLAWMREAVGQGLIGDLTSVHLSMQWDHGWTAGTPFDRIEDLILYDFGVHWFDFLASIGGERLESVYAMSSRAKDQNNKVPLLAQALVRMTDGQASLAFDGAITSCARDTGVITGTEGVLTSVGPDLSRQSVTLTTSKGSARPDLVGTWFEDGFRGTMGELLCAIEEDREPLNGAAENLKSLALTFAAVQSRRTRKEVSIGKVRRLEV